MERYKRTIEVAVERLDNNLISTKASLQDINHNMNVNLKINIKSKEIIEAKAHFVEAPFKICNDTAKLIGKVVGLKVERGIAKKLATRLGKSTGCTHLFELTLEAVRFSSNVMLGIASIGGAEKIGKEISDEEVIQRSMPFLKNACLPYKSYDSSED